MRNIDHIDIRRLDMTLLVVFDETMRHRKLTAVAERLGLTQSTISHALKRLRDIFGDELFIRRSAGVEPTARALELAPVVREILDLALRSLRSGAAFEPASARGVFRIGALDYHCALLAAPLLHRMEAQAPGLRVSFRPAARAQALGALSAGDLDLALGFFWGRVDGLERRELFEDGYVVVARRDHPLVRGGLSLDDYAGAKHLIVSLDGDLSGIVDRALSALGRSREIVAAVPYFLPALAAAAGTDAIATIPRFLALAHAERFELQVLEPPLEIRSFRVSAVWHRRDSSNRLHAWMLDQLQEIGAELAQAAGVRAGP